jgi:hypothetical protein
MKRPEEILSTRQLEVLEVQRKVIEEQKLALSNMNVFQRIFYKG